MKIPEVKQKLHATKIKILMGLIVLSPMAYRLEAAMKFVQTVIKESS